MSVITKIKEIKKSIETINKLQLDNSELDTVVIDQYIKSQLISASLGFKPPSLSDISNDLKLTDNQSSFPIAIKDLYMAVVLTPINQHNDIESIVSQMQVDSSRYSLEMR